jgi:hypothetical protein
MVRAIVATVLAFVALTVPAFQQMHELSYCIVRELDFTRPTPPSDSGIWPSDMLSRPPQHLGSRVESYRLDSLDCR